MSSTADANFTEESLKRRRKKQEEEFAEQLSREHDKTLMKFVKRSVLVALIAGCSFIVWGSTFIEGQISLFILATMVLFTSFITSLFLMVRTGYSDLFEKGEEKTQYFKALYKPSNTRTFSFTLPSGRYRTDTKVIHKEMREELQDHGYDLISDTYDVGVVNRGADNPVILVERVYGKPVEYALPNLYTLTWNGNEGVFTPLTNDELEALRVRGE